MNRLNHALKHAAKLNARREGQDRPGFVYLIQCHDFIKVGYTDKVAIRLSALQTGCPYELKVVAQWHVSQMAKSEYRLHNMWKRYEIRGEWFSVPCGELASAMTAESFEDIFK